MDLEGILAKHGSGPYSSNRERTRAGLQKWTNSIR